MSRGRQSVIGVYRLYNVALSKCGEPFGMCAEHAKKYNPPCLKDGSCVLRKIANDGELACEECEQ